MKTQKKQISDNGSPFNSNAMDKFVNQHITKLQKIAPLHLSSNTKESLKLLLRNYRDTPHRATGVTPLPMLFKDDKCSSFPRKNVTDTDSNRAREAIKKQKQERITKINSPKYKKQDQINIGEKFLIRNHLKQR